MFIDPCSYRWCLWADAHEKTFNIESPRHRHPTVIYYAALHGFCNIIEWLTSHGVDINETGGLFGTVLQVAAFAGYKDAVVTLVLKYGADINHQGGFYGYPVIGAAAFGSASKSEELVRLLLSSGADINVANEGGLTALHLAARRGHQFVVRVLIENGAKANVQSSTGVSPLHQAAYNGNIGVAQLLMENGATRSFLLLFLNFSLTAECANDRISPFVSSSVILYSENSTFFGMRDVTNDRI
ncbi:NACHT domain protein [Aspergillus sclerotialis]|uniref:NACHT domain protein n=1 Tax=Aspergillus sclerotialis TaxID=2070753 RepID=A0A3A2ZUJ4_9EURO|nr:NACHT domain protein [Aspergillus sclerotialis]